MEKGFSHWAYPVRVGQDRAGIGFLKTVLLGLSTLFASAVAASAQDVVMMTAVEDARAVIVQKINAEQVRVDISAWYLNDGDIVTAILNKHRSGVPVRLIGDRGSIFEADPNTRVKFEYLASNGVPIRLRYHPTWFPEIIHWKAGIFVGQGVVEFGSANWTSFELAPFSATDFKDETAMFTSDPQLVNAFRTKFDEYWADTEKFLDWPAAYLAETGRVWPTPMTIPQGRMDAESYPTDVPGMVWEQGTVLTNAMLAEIQRETQEIELVVYRLTIPSITDALIAKHQQGVTVRVFVEPTQYRNQLWPEYELTGLQMDRLWAAGIPIKIRVHEGLMHIKSLMTSHVAMNGSSNFTKNWERDHNYFIPAATKPVPFLTMKNRFDAMWNDSVNYGPFQPQRPATPALLAPAYDAFDTPANVRLEWRRAPWATSYDVYFGPSSSTMTRIARVNAVMTETPPTTYSFVPTQTLSPSTSYYWRVVARTLATDTDPSLTATSELWTFRTAASGNTGGTGSGPCCTNGPLNLPGIIQAENYDNGGANVAYFDTTPGSSGVPYRGESVDVEPTIDTGGGHNVGWVAPGEWLKYSVNVGTAGPHNLEFRVAASGTGGTFHVEANGVNLTGPVSVPNTGGWQAWTTVTRTNVTLAAGPQVWTVVFDAVGPGGAIGNLNYIRVVAGSGGGGPTPPPPPSGPYNGTPAALPGTFQAENFDVGDEGVAYLDDSTANQGGVYRTTQVDIEATSDGGGGYNVGYAFAGEWLAYTVNVTTAGTYDIEARVASNGTGGTFHFEVNGVDRTGPFTVPNTGGWQTWVTIRKTGLTLAAGQQVWRLVMDTNGPTTAVGNFNYFRVVAAGSGGVTPPPAPEIVIYGSDVTNPNLHGNWSRVNDSSAAGGVKIASADNAAPTVTAPLASPTDYFDVTFTAQAGVRYRLWLRMRAAADNKYNDSVFVQFSGANDSFGNPSYRIASGQALNVNLATCGSCALSGWGWQNRGYWEADTGEVWFAATGTQTIRVQIREDGVAIDQIVLSPLRHVEAAPGPPTGDSTIVPKP